MEFYKEIENRQFKLIAEKLGLIIEKAEVKEIDEFYRLFILHSLENFGHRYHIYIFSRSSTKEVFYDSNVIDSDKFISIEQGQERAYNYFKSLVNSLKP